MQRVVVSALHVEKERWLYRILDRITNGEGKEGDLALLEDVAGRIEGIRYVPSEMLRMASTKFLKSLSS